MSVPGSRLYTTFTGTYLFPNYSYPIVSNLYCSCDDTYNCTYQSGFFNNWTIINPYYFVPDPPPVFSVPGILAGCVPHDSILQSTLECFYNSICLDTVRILIGDRSSRRPLDTTIQSRFKLNATVQSIFAELLIEAWYNTSNFTGYFDTCAPASCSYTYGQRFNIAFVFITLFSLIGGLTVTLRFLAPFLVKNIVSRGQAMCCHRVLDEQHVSTTNCEIPRPSGRQFLINIVRQIKQTSVTLNLFKTSSILSDERQGRWATRFYFVLLILSVVILSINSSVTLHTISVTVHNPSQTQFDQMNAEYSLTLSCPCTHLSMPYSSFMSIQPRFHQICSSDFLRNDRWFLYFDFLQWPNLTAPDGAYYPLDFRQPTGQSLFHLMQTLCQLANETVTNALIAFNDTEFTNAEPLSNENFAAQTSLLIQQFEEHTLASFLALLSLVRSSIENNHFYVSSVTNFAQSSFTVNGSWTLRYKPKIYSSSGNEICSCLTSNSCTRPQGFYCAALACHTVDAQPNQTVPGFVISCFPVNSLLFSTLECLYNQSCIQMLLDWRLFDIDQWYQPITLNISALDSHLPSRFLPTTTMNVIISHLLIEEWTNTTNATAHYQQCEPHICTYTYTRRYNTLYVITTILGIGGGLSTVLRLLVPLAIKIIMEHLIVRRANGAIEQDNTIDISII